MGIPNVGRSVVSIGNENAKSGAIFQLKTGRQIGIFEDLPGRPGSRINPASQQVVTTRRLIQKRDGECERFSANELQQP